MLSVLLLLFAALLIYWKLFYPRLHWKRLGVEQVMFGGAFTLKLKKNSFPDLMQYIYRKTTNRYLGIYQFFKPMLVIKDLDLLKQITVKDFDYFTDHMSILPDDDYEPLWSKNLFVLKGLKWREMRSTLSPAFTSSKMKAMFVLMDDCAKTFVANFENENDVHVVDLKDIFTRYANDVIATCAFGVQCDSMKQQDNQFYMMGKDATNMKGLWKSLKFSVFFAMPKIGKFLGITLFSRQAADFFKNLVKDTISLREEQNIIRPDMINLLMEAKNGRLVYEEDKNEAKETGFATVEESNVGIRPQARPKGELSITDMTAQVFIFFFAGFETISNAVSFMGYELAVNPDIQQRLFEEIQETSRKCNGRLSYEALNKMKYMDMVVTETMRKWPNLIAVDRVCTKTYTIEPQSDSENPLTLEKGSIIWIPIWGIHHDPKYYPNPEKFDPERFSDENKGNINPYTYLPFGVGPRNCIGSRFALLEAKVVIFHLLQKFEFVVVDKTPIPMVLDNYAFGVVSKDGFWVGLKRR